MPILFRPRLLAVMMPGLHWTLTLGTLSVVVAVRHGQPPLTTHSWFQVRPRGSTIPEPNATAQENAQPTSRGQSALCISLVVYLPSKKNQELTNTCAYGIGNIECAIRVYERRCRRPNSSCHQPIHHHGGDRSRLLRRCPPCRGPVWQ